MSEPKTYRIETVADFQALPPEKVAACLTDFAEWLRLHANVRLLAESGFVVLAAPLPKHFDWIDDGKHVATVKMTAGDHEVSQSLPFAEPEPTPTQPQAAASE